MSLKSVYYNASFVSVLFNITKDSFQIHKVYKYNKEKEIIQL